MRDSITKGPDVSVIIPTLNEERHIGSLLSSLADQSSVSYETWLIDGGSKDGTSSIAEQHGAEVMVIPGCKEFASRNVGARAAHGRFLFFTGADIILSPGLLAKVVESFEQRPELVALTGPGHPFDASLLGKTEYAVYNFLRFVLARMPKRLRRFSTSTNFLVVRKDCFDKIGGFDIRDVNADGLMGRALLELGEVTFSYDTYVYISARRMKRMGFLNFNRHYLYAFENIFFFLSGTSVIRSLKSRSRTKHGEMREV